MNATPRLDKKGTICCASLTNHMAQVCIKSMVCFNFEIEEMNPLGSHIHLASSMVNEGTERRERTSGRHTPAAAGREELAPPTRQPQSQLPQSVSVPSPSAQPMNVPELTKEIALFRRDLPGTAQRLGGYPEH